jgi:uncharacterized coiled-coil protein SlyX
MIQKLEKKVAEKAKDIMCLKQYVAEKDLQLSMVVRSAEENSVRIKELNVSIAEKQRFIEEMERQIIELREGLRMGNRATENQMLPINQQQTENNVDDTNEVTAELREVIIERDGAIKRLHDTVAQLQKDLAEKESQQDINKQLSNTMKIRQMEPLTKQSPEIEELLNKLRQETAMIVERLVNANSCQATKSNIPSSRSPDKPLRG